jgi:hypothetical protein
MKIYRFVTLILLLNLLVQTAMSQNKEQLIFDRIAYIFKLKPFIAQKYWKGFDQKKYDVPLLYFTETESYIANPTTDFVNFFKPTLVFKNDQLGIYKTLQRFDSLPFHMETSVGIDEPTDKLLPPSPIMYCSSQEEAFKKIPECTTTEYWVTMIIHEYFHGFQFQHKQFLKVTQEKTSQISEDSLAQIHKGNDWFKESLNKENDCLLKALSATETQEINNQIEQFFTLRKTRRQKTQANLKVVIDDVEKIYETMEGTSRYIEYQLQVAFANKQPDPKLSQVDPSYKAYQIFKNYKIENDPWLYTPGKRYFYATGFNIVRLLDKLHIPYKSNLFKDGERTLEQQLENNYKIKQKHTK